MESKKLREIEREIVQQITALEQQLRLTEQSSQTVALDQTLAGRVSRIDAIQQQKMSQSSKIRDLKRLTELKRTRLKLKSNDFGLCEECEQLIAFGRLKINPESKYCISCQQQME